MKKLITNGPTAVSPSKKRGRRPVFLLATTILVCGVLSGLGQLLDQPDYLSGPSPIPVIIDCDPGADDGYALVLAGCAAGLDIRAVTAVYGSLPLGACAQNACALADYIGLRCPVAAGAAVPLKRSLQPSAAGSGAGGLCGVALPVPTRQLDARPAWQLIYDEAVAQNGKLQLICLGPLTNIATALQLYPDLAGKIDKITLLCGNVSLSAREPNASADPHALQLVLQSGIELQIVPRDTAYDCTYLSNPSPTANTDTYWGEIVSPSSRVHALLAGVQRYTDEQWRVEASALDPNGRGLPDLAAVIAVIAPSICQKRTAYMSVGTQSEQCGTTAFYPLTDQPAIAAHPAGCRVTVLTGLDSEIYIQLLRDMVESYR
ncbi:nucleoside hydrolase [Neobittarella massiliensis]|uniref:Nucleoside hydrolase n=1 Tax=Neobittarella massiliensis (ex Bilen et al. 2018) TaxID=2041842 RepID=A0A8J6IDX0_9FIRM|nr:nucleoside hydrolase [Neobittarella massiliensis]MBC3515420.1 nucleoside hydrolase [Neobittarella massiliensis]